MTIMRQVMITGEKYAFLKVRDVAYIKL